MAEFSLICLQDKLIKSISFFLYNYVIIIIVLIYRQVAKFVDDIRLEFLKFTRSLVEQKVWNFYVLNRILKQT